MITKGHEVHTSALDRLGDMRALARGDLLLRQVNGFRGDIDMHCVCARHPTPDHDSFQPSTDRGAPRFHSAYDVPPTASWASNVQCASFVEPQSDAGDQERPAIGGPSYLHTFLERT